MMQVSDAVPHHLELDLFPPHDALFDEHLVDTRTGEAEFDDPDQFFAGLADTAAGAAKGVCGTDYCRKTDLLDRIVDLA